MSMTVEDLKAGRVDLSDLVDPDGVAIGPIHPGEILLEEFMRPLGLSARALATALGVPANRVTAISNGQRGITADTALRLGRYFGTTPDLWLNLQKAYELEQASRTAGPEIERKVRPRAA